MSTGVGDEEFCGGSPLWNLSLTWNAPNLTWPQFTDCFQNTVLIWVPCGWVWVTLPFYIYYLIVHSERQRPLTCLSASKTIFSFILCLLSIIELVKAVENSSQDRVATVVYVSGAVKIATYLFVGILIQLERLSGLVTSGVLFLFWFLLTVSGIIPFYTKIEQQEQNSNLFNFILFYISYAVILLQLILHSFAEYTLQSEPAGSKPKCPETYASFPGRLTFWWLNRLVLTAYKKTLDECDLWELNPRDNSKRVIPQFQKAWIQEEQRCERASRDYEVPHYGSQPDELDETAPLLGKQKKTNKSHQKDKEKKASLLKVMMKIYGSDMLKSHLCKFFYDLLQFVSPLILNVLIEFTGNHDLVWKGYMYSVGLFVVATMQSILFHQNFHIGMTLAMRMKSALISAIYKKALTVCSEEKKSLTVGEIVNLMSVDCQRIQDLVSYLWILWSAPLQISLSLYLLYNTMGSSIFAGLGIMILMIPLNGWITTKTRNYQSKQMKIKDDRIKLMNEVLNGVKVLKLYAWEPSFKQKILKIRNKELTLLKKSAYLYAVTVATFTTYVFISEDHRLDSQKAFVALSLFNILRSPLNLLPMLIAYVAQAQVSVSRINRFLNTKDLNPKNVIHEYQPENVISIKQGSFTWDREGTPGLLDINLEVPAGKLVAVVGQVGAGKSSLISGILGEMEKLTGTVNVQGSVAYVPQQAWIQNATLHDNILFGSQLKGDLYKKVIDACALKHDLGILPGGDMTEIGERGINLSGGQKQRVSLARAVYNSADIYLLDDPLSAVDSHVGKHIFNEVIGPSGLLKKQTRILVTHGVHWLPQVDLIVVLVNGRITELGSYNDLLSHNGAFAQFLKTYLAEDDSSDDDDPEIMHLKSEILQRVDSVVSGGVPSTTSEDEAETKLTRRSTSRDSSKFGQREGRKLSLSRSLTKEKKLVAEKAADGEIVGKRLTEEEQSETGKVKLNVYILYAKALGVTATALMFLMFGLYQVTTVFSSVWLSKWTEDPLLLDSSKINTTAYRDKTNLYLGVFGSLGIVQAVMVLTYSILSSLTMVNAAGALHKKMLHNILRSPMSFFDTTPLGRIINRFSRDMETIDNNLPMIVRSWIATIFTVMSTIVVISYSTPIFLSVIFPLGVLYYLIQRFFIPTSRQLKRIESTTRSPIYTHFSETITGASSIRAYRAVQRFIQESQDYVDKNLVFYFGGIAANRWLGFRLELVGNTIVLAAATFTVMNRDTLNGGLVGLSITYALQITQFLNWLVRNTSELETNIVSVERVMEYSKTPTEAEWELPFKPVSGWPQHGVVEFRDYCTRYRPGLDLVLRGISCYIKAGEKVGIVGRTGAGKSSLTVALFRLIESAGGAIMIDDQRISDIGLHDLRSKLTILPQDPVLFSGSLRFNLDPFDQHADEQIWQALEHAHLKQFVMELPLKLEHECGEGGQNLSVGQSQLLCLARTLLHKTNILILDEATAAVDMETDDLIQTTIREEFKQCTVLTIAHRLNTIMDYDRVMVLDAGLIKEFDSPHELLQNKKSIFYGMAKDAGLV